MKTVEGKNKIIGDYRFKFGKPKIPLRKVPSKKTRSQRKPQEITGNLLECLGEPWSKN